MKSKIEQFNNDITDIIEKMKKVINKINSYYKIYSNFINNFEMINYNYQNLNNINEILNYNYNNILNEINEIIEEPLEYKKINKVFDLYNIIFNNKNIIIYKISKDEEKIKIFGNKFVKNNKNKCKIIHEKKEYNLEEYFDIDKENNNNTLEIELKINDDIIDMSYMFESCTSLIFINIFFQ